MCNEKFTQQKRKSLFTGITLIFLLKLNQTQIHNKWTIAIFD